MNPKKKILILSGCLLTVAAVVGGTFFVQKSSNHVLNKTSIGKFHEAEAHTATGFVVCKTEALQEVFQQKKEEAEKELQDMLAAAQEAEYEEEVLLAEQEVLDESDGKNEKTDKKGTQEVTPGKGTTEPASTAGGQVPSAQENATTSGGQEPVGGIPAAPSDTPSETPAAPSDTPSETPAAPSDTPSETPATTPTEQPAEETKPANPCPYPLWTVMSFDDGTMGYYWPMDYDIADAVRVDKELYELHYTRLVSTTFVGNYDGAYHVRLSKFSYHIPYADD